MSSPIAARLAQSVGHPTLAFPTPGTRHGGTVTRADVIQQTDIKTKLPQWWDDQQTRPKELMVFTLDTGVVDPTIDGDDGLRSLYVKVWGPQLAALQDAAERAGVRDVTVGDYLAATFTHEIPSDKPGLSATKAITYELRPAGTAVAVPAVPAAAAVPAPAAAAPAPAAPPTPAAPPAPAAPNPAAAAMAAMRDDVKTWQAAGWTDEQLLSPAAAGAGFPHAAALEQLRATGADPLAVLASIRTL